MAAEPAIARNASLDAARGVLMMLGVVLHAANIYTVQGGWLVWDTQRSVVFDAVSQLIHVFRMPAFFWISGYFCALTFQRNGSKGLLHKRLPRLAIPLFSTWLTFNVAQDVLTAAMRGEDIRTALSEGVGIYHLWFLVDLLFYMVLAALLLPLGSRLSPLVERLGRLPLALMLPALAVFSVGLCLAARVTGVAYDGILGVTSLFRLVSHAPFFIVGICMYTHVQARQTFLNVPIATLVVALPVAVLADRYTRGHGLVVNELAFFVEYLMTWIGVAAVLRAFHTLFKRESPSTRFLSDAAYSVFLFHHLVVVVMGQLLLPYPIGAFPKFLLVASVGLGLPALMHIVLIRKNRTARWLFNGK